jgi:hypothetical protein
MLSEISLIAFVRAFTASLSTLATQTIAVPQIKKQTVIKNFIRKKYLIMNVGL